MCCGLWPACLFPCGGVSLTSDRSSAVTPVMWRSVSKPSSRSTVLYCARPRLVSQAKTGVWRGSTAGVFGGETEDTYTHTLVAAVRYLCRMAWVQRRPLPRLHVLQRLHELRHLHLLQLQLQRHPLHHPRAVRGSRHHSMSQQHPQRPCGCLRPAQASSLSRMWPWSQCPS